MPRVRQLEFIDFNQKSIERLKELNGMEVLIPESREIFLKWCDEIRVNKRVTQYHPFVIDYQEETAYRSKRDKEHKFRDILERSMTVQFKTEFRRNKAVLPIVVSNEQVNRVSRIINILIQSIQELGGSISVDSREDDNAEVRLLGQNFSIQVREIMVKRRSLLSESVSEKTSLVFGPMYEKLPSGRLEIQFHEILDYRIKNRIAETITFSDSVDEPIEEQVGEIFRSLLKIIGEALIAKFIAGQEDEIKRQEQMRLREAETEKRKKLEKLEEQERLKKHLMENIDTQMRNWYKSQDLRKYAGELEAVISTLHDPIKKRQLTTYIQFVHQLSQESDPILGILNEIRLLGME
ncbi:hypothetical protein GCM10008018_45430 [Paenibacillus marchantiophytorum]|uniref:Uncharacterized protein n=1 Tax=Paenibacillus marchantiophytorum TaxID=1619310 RepID=A0ABQ1F069_9BACL|nr:hypothetical protein [Paenibacillus marchantiophytorum]GFZ93888.1 hypothetical protein GCM10008018_45430 [Paenibacillus marchantiophytorum]